MPLSTIIQVAAVIILAAATWRGYRLGFLKTVLSLVSILLSLYLVSYVQPYVLQAMDRYTPVRSTVTASLQQVLEERAVAALGDMAGTDGAPVSTPTMAGTDVVPGNIPLSGEQQKQLLAISQLPETLRSRVTTTAQETAADFARRVSSTVAGSIMQAISYLLSFLLVFAAIRILYHALDLIGRVPLLHGVNKILGAAAGFGEGVLILWLLSLVVTVLIPSHPGQQLMEAISGNPLLANLYDLALSFGKL